MRLFTTKQLRAAIQYAKEGGQALHVHPFTSGHRLFARYNEAGHLFDQNFDRLVLTAKRLGIRVIKVERIGTDKQHIDICATPLALAKRLCEVVKGGKQ